MSRIPKLPICETRLATADEIGRWARTARPGESLVYCVGPALPRGATGARARALAEDGVVTLVQRRAATCTGLEYLVVKRAAPPVEAAATARADPAIERVFEALRGAARRGRRAPSDFQLARIAGLASRAQAQWRVRRLAETGRIAIETVPGPDGPWRVVRIGRHETLRPGPAVREGCDG